MILRNFYVREKVDPLETILSRAHALKNKLSNGPSISTFHAAGRRPLLDCNKTFICWSKRECLPIEWQLTCTVKGRAIALHSATNRRGSKLYKEPWILHTYMLFYKLLFRLHDIFGICCHFCYPRMHHEIISMTFLHLCIIHMHWMK